MLILDGRALSYERAFGHQGSSDPANGLRLSSYEEKTAIGITEVPGPAPYDQRFYWGPELPKDHEGLVTLWIDNTNQTAYTLLAPSDWYVIRKQETEVAVPQEVLDRRSEIRTYCDTKRKAISATTTTDELAAYITSTAYSEWEPPAPTPEPTPEEIVETPEGEDSIIFSGGVTSAGIVDGASGDDVISFG